MGCSSFSAANARVSSPVVETWEVCQQCRQMSKSVSQMLICKICWSFFIIFLQRMWEGSNTTLSVLLLSLSLEWHRTSLSGVAAENWSLHQFHFFLHCLFFSFLYSDCVFQLTASVNIFPAFYSILFFLILSCLVHLCKRVWVTNCSLIKSFDLHKQAWVLSTWMDPQSFTGITCMLNLTA